MATPLLIGSGMFAACVAIQVMSIVAILLYIKRRDRLGRFHDNLVEATGTLSGGMLIIFLGICSRSVCGPFCSSSSASLKATRPPSTTRW